MRDPIDRPDAAIFLAGFVAVGTGCWLAWPPLGLIVPGLIMMAAVIATRIGGRRRHESD